MQNLKTNCDLAHLQLLDLKGYQLSAQGEHFRDDKGKLFLNQKAKNSK